MEDLEDGKSENARMGKSENARKGTKRFKNSIDIKLMEVLSGQSVEP